MFVSSCVWIGYYLFRERNLHHVAVFSVALAVNLVLYLAYVRFVKFMERP